MTEGGTLEVLVQDAVQLPVVNHIGTLVSGTFSQAQSLKVTGDPLLYLWVQRLTKCKYQQSST